VGEVEQELFHRDSLGLRRPRFQGPA
jgi:hypothetical protein